MIPYKKLLICLSIYWSAKLVVWFITTSNFVLKKVEKKDFMKNKATSRT